jgi:hypothetical protein
VGAPDFAHSAGAEARQEGVAAERGGGRGGHGSKCVDGAGVSPR